MSELNNQNISNSDNEDNYEELTEDQLNELNGLNQESDSPFGQRTPIKSTTGEASNEGDLVESMETLALTNEKTTANYLIIDTNALISGTRLETLGKELWTIDEVLDEVRDKKTSDFVNAFPFEIKTRQPSPESLKAVIDFSMKTGDYPSLSATDLKLIALTHTFEVEVNGSDHLKTEPEKIFVTTKQPVNNNNNNNKSFNPSENNKNNHHHHHHHRNNKSKQSKQSSEDKSKVKSDNSNQTSIDNSNNDNNTTTTTTQDKPKKKNRPGKQQRMAIKKKLEKIAAEAAASATESTSTKEGEEEKEKVELSVEASIKPVESSDKPVETSVKAVEESIKPVESSDKPVETSVKAVEESIKPVESSDKPVEKDNCKCEHHQDKEEEKKEESVSVSSASTSTKPTGKKNSKKNKLLVNLEKIEEEVSKEKVIDPNEVLRQLKQKQAEEAEERKKNRIIQKDDEGEWITPDNISKISTSYVQEKVHYDVGCITRDFSMQNVILQMGLHLISVDGIVIKQVKQFVLKCVACLNITMEMDRIFCQHCGNKSLYKATTYVDRNGNQRVSVGSAKQFNLRGTIFSIPKPKGGKKHGDMILTEDQYIHRLKVTGQYYKKKVSKEVNLDDLELGFGHTGPSDNIVIGYGNKNPNIARKKIGKKNKSISIF